MILIGREHISRYIQQFPASRTALVMWHAIAESAAWKSAAEAISCYPSIKFLTPKLAHFVLSEINCVVTAQIAFNNGVLIVLAVSEANIPTKQQS